MQMSTQQILLCVMDASEFINDGLKNEIIGFGSVATFKGVRFPSVLAIEGSSLARQYYPQFLSILSPPRR